MVIKSVVELNLVDEFTSLAEYHESFEDLHENVSSLDVGGHVYLVLEIVDKHLLDRIWQGEERYLGLELVYSVYVEEFVGASTHERTFDVLDFRLAPHFFYQAL